MPQQSKDTDTAERHANSRHFSPNGPAVICLIVLCLLLLISNQFKKQALSLPTWMDTAQTVVALLALYAVKSATMVFPLMVLQLAAGHLLPTGIALCVNLAGVILVLTTPYWIGRKFGKPMIQKLAGEHPHIESILERQQDHAYFLCFFLRMISGLPGDVVTMYLGATKIPYSRNLVGGLIGVLPRVLLTTVLGSSIRDPRSPGFWISAITMLILSIASMIIYRFYRRKILGNH